MVTEMSLKISRQPLAHGLPRVHSQTRYLLILALGVLGASAAVGAAVGASRLNLVVPPASSGSLGDATAILINNLEIWALLVAAVLLQPRGVPTLTPGFLPLWLTDLTVALVAIFNLVVIGGALGALGLPALLRMAPHAPLELGAFLLVIVAYLSARQGRLQRHDAMQRFALACVLLICGAFVESYISGGLG